MRDCFQENRNACRRTEYKPLVDAVMDAAKVLRGERRNSCCSNPARMEAFLARTKDILQDYPCNRLLRCPQIVILTVGNVKEILAANDYDFWKGR